MTDAARPSIFTYIDLPFPPAERIGARVEYYHSPHQGLYGLNVYFVGLSPEHETIDRVLRECTALAAAHDDSINIFVDAYLLPDESTDLETRKTLSPYGSNHFLCFDASLRQIGVRRVGTKHFVDNPDAIGVDDAETDDEIDDATEDMACEVENLIWYGFDSPEEIEALIDGDAASGAGFDIDRVKAVAAETLAKKRAAEAGWPQTTDCDKLDRIFARLHEQGICALQCAGNTMDDGFEAVGEVLSEDSVPEDRYHGYCFFHSQDIDGALGEEGLLLAFGHVDRGEAKEEAHIAVGQLICEALRQVGLTVDWDGSPDHRIDVPQLRWQRRTPG